MAEQFLSGGIEKDLRGDDPDAILFRGLGIFPDIKKNDFELPSVFLFQFLENRRHHLAGNAFSRAQIE